MDLVRIAEGLAGKAKAYSTRATKTESELFVLREEIRVEAKRIICTIDGPEQAVKNVAREFTSSTALKICIDLNLVHHLRQDEECSTEELASRSGANVLVLRAVIRLLAHQGIFEQTGDGKWRHTKMSEVLMGAPFQAMLQTILEENYEANAKLPSYLRENGYQFPVRGHTSFNAVFKTPLDFYTYCNENDHKRGARFAFAMTEVARKQLLFLDHGYPFEKLESGTRYVDVAGGLGHTCHFLARRLPEATFVVQDHPTVLAEAKQACPAELRERVSFEAHDMFSAQPKSGTAAEQTPSGIVFLLKIILHDHGDEACKTILRHLLAVMGARDRILIIDLVIPETGGSISSSISDLLTLSLFGSRHRTLQEWKELINGSETGLVVKTFTAGAEEFDGLMVIEVRKSQDKA